jgi:hypothetical protein
MNTNLYYKLIKKLTLLEQSSVNAVLFSKIGDILEEQIMPFEFLNIQFYLEKSTYIKFNITFSKNLNLGVYFNKNTLPTYTKFTFFEAFNGYGVSTKQISVFKIIFFFPLNIIILII